MSMNFNMDEYRARMRELAKNDSGIVKTPRVRAGRECSECYAFGNHYSYCAKVH